MVFADSLRNHITYYTYDYRTMKFVFAIKSVNELLYHAV